MQIGERVVIEKKVGESFIFEVIGVLSYNDLPLDAYCLTVQADVLRLLDEEGCQVSLGLDAAGLEDGGQAPS